jgi:hypothetical protein
MKVRIAAAPMFGKRGYGTAGTSEPGISENKSLLEAAYGTKKS